MTPLLTSKRNLPGPRSEPVVHQGRQVRVRRPRLPDSPRRLAALPARIGTPGSRPRSASPSTATRRGPAISPAAGSGPSSGSKAAGCSRCRSCSSPPPSGWSAAGPVTAAASTAPITRRLPDGGQHRTALPGAGDVGFTVTSASARMRCLRYALPASRASARRPGDDNRRTCLVRATHYRGDARHASHLANRGLDREPGAGLSMSDRERGEYPASVRRTASRSASPAYPRIADPSICVAVALAGSHAMMARTAGRNSW